RGRAPESCVRYDPLLGRGRSGDRRWILVAERQELHVGYLLGDRGVVGLHVHARAAQELLLVGASHDGAALADDDPHHAEYRTSRCSVSKVSSAIPRSVASSSAAPSSSA